MSARLAQNRRIVDAPCCTFWWWSVVGVVPDVAPGLKDPRVPCRPPVRASCPERSGVLREAGVADAEWSVVSSGRGAKLPGPGSKEPSRSGLTDRWGRTARRTQGPDVQHPLLKLIDGGRNEPVKGRDVLDALAPVIADLLPAVPPQDPWRPTLERLLRAAQVGSSLRSAAPEAPRAAH